MLKKPCLKHFIFFLTMLSWSFYNYGNNEKAQRTNAKFLANFIGNNYNPNQFNDDVSAETPMFKVIQGSVKRGAADALSNSALTVISTILKIVPYSVNKCIQMIRFYAYKVSFGTTGLTVKDLTKCSNRIHFLCTPLATSQVGNMRKTKRVATIESEQGNDQSIDIVWLKKRALRISELEHIVSFLKSVLPCYNAAFQSIDTSPLEKAIASILYTLTTENNHEIQNYLIRLIGYITDLIMLLESFNSLDNALERSDETKELLNVIRATFEHIATFLTDSTIKGATGFQKISDDSGSGKRDLMDILGGNGLK